jgi:hypothetical protein
MVDYTPATIATLRPGSSLRAVFAAGGHYAAHEELLEGLVAEDEGGEVVRARWADLPQEVLDRGQPRWFV